MQEPLSVLFSIINLVAHSVGYNALTSSASPVGYNALTSSASRHRQSSSTSTLPHDDALDTLRFAYKVYSVAGLNTWIWSSVFHTRDTSWTERADYFAAAAGMICGLWMAVIRLFRLFETRQSNQRGRRLWTTTCLTVFVMHCKHLTRGTRFDYSYNMTFNVTIALLQISLWAAWSFYHVVLLPRRQRQRGRTTSSRHQPSKLDQAAVMSSEPTPGLQLSSNVTTTTTRFATAPHALRPLFPLILLPALSALELLDFEPVGPGKWRLLDAHALWHLSTVPVVLVWYRFLLMDLDWVGKRSRQSDRERWRE
ncbi:hypothetical protein ACM66B_004762 [Microbotryomycetes sp. NB124-2]